MLDERGVAQPLYVRTERNATLGRATVHQAAIPIAVGAWLEDGTPIPEVALHRIRRAPVTIEPQIPEQTVRGRAIYGGLLFDHWGHFLIETLARYWALRDNDRVILWSAQMPRRPLATWQRDIFALLRLDEARFRFLVRPATCLDLAIPTAGLVLGTLCDRRLTDAMGVFPFAAPSGKRVWLSRSWLKDRSRVLNENVLEAMLSAAGWTVVHPETLSVHDQLTASSDAEVIAGFDGSAFHTLLLARDVRARLLIVPRGTTPRISATYQLISDAKGIEQRLVVAGMRAIDMSGGRGLATFELSAPDQLFADLMDAAAPRG